MAISNNLFDALYEAEKINSELQLGFHKSYLRDIQDGADTLGIYFCLILEQTDTDVCTAPCRDGEMRFKDIAKIHRGENRINKAGYATKAGDGWKRFFDAIYEQFPDMKTLGWGKTLENLQGKTLKVWYTRTSKGYINCHFSEKAYRYAISNGEEGDGEYVDSSKALNEDCPF